MVKMKNALKKTTFLLIISLIFNIFSITNIGAISINQPINVVIDRNENKAFTSIQEAIDNAPDGSTILVKPGVYNEILNIKKKITLQGEDKENTIINPISENNKYGIRLGSPGIIIKNLSISNGGPGLYTTAIKVVVNNVIIEDCNIYDTPIGVAIFTSKNTIKNCEIWGCKDEGIALIGTEFSDCSENKIINCKFHDNCDGIELQYSSDNKIIDCEIFNNTHTGIDAISSKNDRNEIINCKIYNNTVHGIYLHSSSENQISDCIFSNNLDGDIIEVKNSQNNQIINSIHEHELNDIREMLMNFLNFFQKRYSKARLIIESIFKTYRNLCF